ncbi:MAG TPA: MarR family transcriptional regulator [Chloroflexota bacterium]|jgi:DNA-binding MarR family transcriptional regulator
MSRQSSARRHLLDDVQAELRGLGTEIDRLDALAADAFGLNRTDMRCLDLLGRMGPQTPTALAQALAFTTGGMTTVIDRLEQAGYARRRADPADRRRVIIEPTRLLQRREAEIFGRLIESTEALLAGYSDADLATVRDFLSRSRETIASHAESLHQRSRSARHRATARA